MATRSLTISWETATSRKTAQHLSGREYIEANMAGKIPPSPISQLMGFVTTEIGDGFIVIECVPGEQHYNLIGCAHGGLASTLLDTCMGGSVQSTMPAGYAAATLELKINYVRAITVETGKLRCEGKVIHPGKRIATAGGRIVDAAGKLYAHGSTTMLIFPMQEKS
ncbi:MAG: hypothetical protein A3H35_00275 [Betaproteobacteria bacterium RIFCSPLOWO2_02_FULL_62_17]|nr:MAG: hypothetical protein A3H35_00275 [Betaproteobacteria bacterium RIFCSPLOWO2_02_FULL_62_17]